MSIAEAMQYINEKVVGASLDTRDLGLFQPAQGNRKAQWLAPDRTFRFYDILSGVRQE